MKIKDLQKIGLSEKEAAVYLALLELGSDTVQNIAEKSKVNRATSYVILDSLIKKGIVSTVEKGKKTYYAAESPQELIRLIKLEETELKERERELKSMLPQLKAMYNLAENKPVVRFYEGKEGLKTMSDELFRVKDKKNVVMFYSVDAVENIFNKQERKEMSEERIKKGIQLKSIVAQKTGDLFPAKLSKRRIIPLEKYKFKSDIAIFDNKVRIASLGKNPSGVIIEDKDIADSLRTIFELAWDATKKYSK